MIRSTARWGLSGLLMAVACALLPLSSAAAAPNRFSSPPQITVGPLPVAHGFKAQILSDCNQRPDFANLLFSKAGHDYRLSYGYFPRTADRAASCKVTKKLGSATLTLRLGGAVDVKLKFGSAGTRRRLTRKGCTGTLGYVRKVTGTGTLKVKIHPKVFGKLALHSVAARIQVYSGRAHCPSSSSSNFVNLTAGWPPHDNRQLDAYMAPSGRRHLYMSLQDSLGRKMWEDVQDTFTGSRKLFSFASDLSSAHIGSPGPLLTGSLGYSATSSCATGVTNGLLKGRLVVHDPVLGRLTFRGGRAQQPAVSRGGHSCAVS